MLEFALPVRRCETGPKPETPSRGRVSIWLVALVLGVAGVAGAEDEASEGWAAKADLSFVRAAGNATAETLGLKGTVTRKWEQGALTLKAEGLRAESVETRRLAVGEPEDFVLVEERLSQLTAERYLLNVRYDHKISERFLWHLGVGWERNRFSGIENRSLALGGLGTVWLDREGRKFKTAYAVTVTRQEDVEPLPGADITFVGVRLSWDLALGLGENGSYTNTLVLDQNLEQTSDFRGDMVNSIAVAVSKRLALKLSLQWLYDHSPALASVPLESGSGSAAPQTVSVELKSFDTIFTTSVVVSF
jgi:putative salt-induced outer membrane protein YdiY